MEDKLFHATNLGLTIKEISNTINMKPEEDFYPGLLNKSISYQVKNEDRILHAMMYLQVSRFRELFMEYMKNDKYIDIKNYYQQNLLTMASQKNHPTNMFYSFNSINYDLIFWTIIKLLQQNISKLFYKDGFGRSPIANTIYDKHYHYFFALLNYGAQVTDDDYKIDDNFQTNIILNLTSETSIKSFLKSDKMKKIMNSSLPIGTKLLEITEECPITCMKIKCPVIIEDGFVYEFNALKNHLIKNGLTSPMTNKKIQPYLYIFLEDRFEKIN